jgi:hypothetical protein
MRTTPETLTGYVCWQEDLDAVIQNTALVVKDAMFMATHVPMEVKWKRNHGGGIPSGNTEESFVEAFLQGDHVHALIEGPNGSGKSHFVRWVSTRIPESPNRKVLLFTRVDTNLRSLLTKILDLVKDDPAFEEMRQDLKTTLGATEIADPVGKLALELAHCIGLSAVESGVIDAIPDLDEREMALQLSRELPSLLLDKQFLGRLTRPGGTLDLIVQEHMIGSRPAEARAKRYEIQAADLPIEIGEIELESLAIDARQVFKKITAVNEKYRSAALLWINQNLDRAIRMFLHFSGDRLNEMLLEVRRALGLKNIELIILIEDFAKTQFFDKALLEAVLVEPDQVHPDLCTLRSLFAVTSGYLEQMATVRQRVTLYATLEVEGNLEGFAERMTGRYLNALRLGTTEVSEWDSGRLSTQLPNACDRCSLKAGCHAAFGSNDGFGLYPFNAKAVQTMYSAAKKAEPTARDVTGFVPRILLNKVLRKVVGDCRQIIKEKNFPTPHLTNDLGIAAMSPITAQRLEQQVRGRTDASRYRPVIELYGDPGDLSRASTKVFEAFGIPPLTAQSDSFNGPDPEPIKPNPETMPPDLSPTKEPMEIGLLAAWGNGQIRLSAELTAKLQKAMYEHLLETFPWNELMLVPSLFTKDSALFSNRSFGISDAAYEGGGMGISISLPLASMNRVSTAAGFQGLLLYEHYKSWDFPSGPMFGRAFASLIDNIVDALRPQFERGGMSEPWEFWRSLALVDGTIQRVMGVPLEGNSAFFGKLSNIDASFRSQEWRDLVRAVEEYEAELKTALLWSRAASKGATETPQMVDGASLETIRKELISNPVSELGIPSNTKARWKGLREVGRALQDLHTAIEAEFKLQRDCYSRLRAALTEPDDESPLKINVRKLSENLRIAADGIRQAGIVIVTDRNARQWEADLEGLTDALVERTLAKEVQFNQASTLAQKMLAIEDGVTSNGLYKLDNFVARWQKTLSDANSSTTDYLKNVGGESEQANLTFERLEEVIIEMTEILSEFSGGPDDAG